MSARGLGVALVAALCVTASARAQGEAPDTTVADTARAVPVPSETLPVGRAPADTGHPRRSDLETQAGEPLPPAPPLGDAHAFAALSLKLTRTGERVLEQKADRVTLLNADRWVGGTHITPSTGWRWDPAAQLLVAPG